MRDVLLREFLRILGFNKLYFSGKRYSFLEKKSIVL